MSAKVSIQVTLQSTLDYRVNNLILKQWENNVTKAIYHFKATLANNRKLFQKSAIFLPYYMWQYEKNTIKTTPKDTSECGWPFRSHPWSQWGQQGPQGPLLWEWTNAPYKGLGGGTQRNLSSAIAPAVTTQESTEDFLECHHSQRHWHQESLSSSAVGQRVGNDCQEPGLLVLQ